MQVFPHTCLPEKNLNMRLYPTQERNTSQYLEFPINIKGQIPILFLFNHSDFKIGLSCNFLN